jgi:BirA family biotin operon repressor/biotin-[acetyl-CoA-carboxylase] ligase
MVHGASTPGPPGDNPYYAIASGSPGCIGFDIRYFREVDSTQRIAAALAREGVAEGTAVIAESQSEGRGRLGRSWYSPAGMNLYTSVILRPRIPLSEVPQLGLVAGVAVAEALETVAPGLVSLKWPNDVWLRGRKTGGVLAEALTDADSGLLAVLIGIGVNLNLPPSEIPFELRDKATSVLAMTGARVDRARFAANLFRTLGLRYRAAVTDGFAAVRDLYQQYFALNGRYVSVIDGNATIRGIVRGVDKDGALVLETELGRRRIVSGDVTLEGVYD